jgi:hypothetical protein
MNCTNLENAAKLLDAWVPNGTGFDMGYWWREEQRYWDVPASCHTVACAIGYLGMEERSGIVVINGNPTFNGSHGWDAVVKYFEFGLYATAEKLFQAEYYPLHVTPQDVAARIRLLLHEGETRFLERTFPNRHDDEEDEEAYAGEDA